MTSNSEHADLPPGLSEAQIAMLQHLADPDTFMAGQHESDVFAQLVVQQMTHLMAKVAQQDRMLARLQEQISDLHQWHIRTHAAHAATDDQEDPDESDSP